MASKYHNRLDNIPSFRVPFFPPVLSSGNHSIFSTYETSNEPVISGVGLCAFFTDHFSISAQEPDISGGRHGGLRGRWPAINWRQYFGTGIGQRYCDLP